MSDPTASVRRFLSEHRDLVLKHARAYVRTSAETIAPEDVAREMELEVLQLCKAGLDAERIASPDAMLRGMTKHAAGRAKRRRKLIEQIAAGDDLQAVSEDLASLDADLPIVDAEEARDATEARAKLDRVKGKLAPRDALIFALLVEDERSSEDASAMLTIAVPTVEDVRARILETAATELPDVTLPPRGRASDGDAARLGQSGAEGMAPIDPALAAREHALRLLARAASDAKATGNHPGEPVLALLRSGDQSEDLADAITHVACCADCRAELTEGHVERREVVVMAIEAPRASQGELEKAAEEAHARLLERGAGRWAAVVESSNVEKLKQQLEGPAPESSKVSRLAVGTPFEVPVEELRHARQRAHSYADVPLDSGIDAAEVQAWAQVARKPRQRTPGPSPGWILLAIVAIGGAMVVAYLLAVR